MTWELFNVGESILSDEFIQLERTFHELSVKGGDSDEIDYRNLGIGKSLVWSDLLNGHRTIILSEAGSGKTEEIRHAAQKLRAEGKPAFFMRLEHLSDDFDIAFEEGSLAEFEQWLASSDEGWLFLDSVDESRLREPLDFERAIRKIGVRLTPAFQRVRIVISGRGSAWRPVSDLALCRNHLKYSVPLVAPQDGEKTEVDATKSAQDGFRIVALDDLGEKQVNAFAKARGITSPKAFVDAIERADAWSMAARPDDLNELVAFWGQNQRIGNRLELMQSSIQRRLAERDENRAAAFPLSAADAMVGARSVAAAATLANDSTIRVPDGLKNANGLPVASILPDWDEKKCSALLARPIFDEAIYGTVRFHHRTVREYLTAEWFKSLLDRETSRRKIESLFFRNQYGMEVIVPTMRPVLVWLILLDDKMCARARAISPELIFEGGEPKVLPVETRRQILLDVCEKKRTGVAHGQMDDYRAVQRFADKDLANDVKSLLAKHGHHKRLAWFLLRMVWQGELVEALPESKQIALDRKAEQYARIAAFRAVRAVGTPADIAQVRESFRSEASALSREWLAELIDDLPATETSIQWLLDCITKLKPKARHTVDGLPRALDAFIQRIDLDPLVTLLNGLHALISKKPYVERRHCEISQRYGWLIKSAAQAAERLIVARHPAALSLPVLSILQHLPAAQHFRDWDLRDIRSNIPSLISAWPELNDALFWRGVRETRRVRRKKRERVTAFWQVSHFWSYWHFSTDDFERILPEIQRRELPDDQLVALSLAYRLYVDAKRPRKWLNALKAEVKHCVVLSEALQSHLNPPPQSEQQRRWRKQEREFERSSQRRIADDAKRAQSWKDLLQNEAEKLRNPNLPKPTDISTWQHYLHEKMREKETHSGHWSDGNWQSLKGEFGDEVAQAFRDGVVAYWRRFRPRLRSEGKSQNRTMFGVIFGLTGLSIEARETENWAVGLNEVEADTAFRYAMDELNGFPDWMPALFSAHLDQMTQLLLREVDRDLRVETVKTGSHYVLADLSWSGTWAWPQIGEGILSRLTEREPKNMSNLGYMLNILNGSTVGDAAIARLAETRSTDRRLNHAARWFAVWTGVEPERAIPAISARIATIRDANKKTTFAMQFITHLLGGRRSHARVREAFRKPAHLKDLYTLMHHHIREKDDIHRAGTGVYSPALRDDAQDGRNQLFSLLKEIPGKEAFLALVELSHLHPEPSSRPWMLHHAKTKAEQDADLSPWAISQTLEFQATMERTPTNHRELFDLVEMRFLDLKDNLEHGDSSISSILKDVTQETEIRKYIGEWVRDRALGRYSIPQEEELADAKRPDFRVHGSGFDAPVPVELKLADNWSGPELIERLENQLCRDYLRDTRSNRGLFVLVYRGEKGRWEIPNVARKVDFSGLVRALEAHWTSISGILANVDDIRVIGIDLTHRSG